ncbi:uncharacterized protein [Rutidosis leptorrhynchoides]|uniref:uncharacterized protein n=1 Tax=Rutidosis leptorrhynchoides TaxID=125765 RepID=UPI003A99322B
MGRLPDQPPQSSDQPPSPPPPPQGYPNHHNNPLSPPPPPQEDALMTKNDHNTMPRSYIPESMPPPETYPPQKPTTYPPKQSEAYPPQQPNPVQFPPQQQPNPVQFPPQQQRVQYPPNQQQAPYNVPPPQYNYVYTNNAQAGQPQGVNFVSQAGYQTTNMGPQSGVPIGNQYIAQTQEWKTGLFDCADDMENAIITVCFPCITFGQIAEILDNGQTSCATSGLLYGLIAALIGIPCIMSCSYRTKMRSRYGLMETPAPDWVTHCFCEWCALCQVYRELKNRGLDPSIGWQGNMVKNQQMQQYPMTTPPMNQQMM